MEQIKLKTFTAETLELLESNINEFLGSEEAANLKLVNITIKEIEERTFPNNEEEFNAILTLSVNNNLERKVQKYFCAFLYRRKDYAIYIFKRFRNVIYYYFSH